MQTETDMEKERIESNRYALFHADFI